MIEFFVPGVPAPGGSKKSFRHATTGKIVTIDDAKNNKGWRDRVSLFARQAWQKDPVDTPLSVRMVFTVSRPKGHYGSGRNAGRVKATAPAFPDRKPDVLKLARSTEDALTGILWVDDARTVRLEIEKRYGDAPGVLVNVRCA